MENSEGGLPCRRAHSTISRATLRDEAKLPLRAIGRWPRYAIDRRSRYAIALAVNLRFVRSLLLVIYSHPSLPGYLVGEGGKEGEMEEGRERHTKRE
ncbi:MAG: hypothetical protein F6K56_43330 [Moorea sp. SIO3G5]|nr:hypothetical protein [Moorena sp. SIO3G5]